MVGLAIGELLSLSEQTMPANCSPIVERGRGCTAPVTHLG